MKQRYHLIRNTLSFVLQQCYEHRRAWVRVGIKAVSLMLLGIMTEILFFKACNLALMQQGFISDVYASPLYALIMADVWMVKLLAACFVGATAWYDTWIIVALSKTALNAYDSGKITFHMTPYRLYVTPFLIISLSVALLTILGSLLFIVPGIFLAIRLWFAGYVSIDKHLSMRESLIYSWRITRFHEWDIFLMLCLKIALNIIPFVGQIAALLCSVYMYRKLEPVV